MAKTAKLKSESAASAMVLLVFALLAAAAVVYLYNLIPNSPPAITLSTTVPSGTNQIQQSTTTVGAPVQGSQLVQYALMLINKDRNDFGLQNVTLSNETSGQQHSDSMLSNDYFSHWDIYGMKPYMRYTLLGGLGAVSENIAYRYSTECGLLGCRGNIDPMTSIQTMEHSMIYNDSACCNNGHRDNILDPHHNQVSIGISYNSSTVYFAEDFIDNYINWDSNKPSYSNGEVSLSGAIQNGYTLPAIEVVYDQPGANMTQAQLKATSTYGYGTTIAGVAANSNYYYQGITTIVADRYSVSGNRFNVAFSMQSLIGKYHAGEYTIITWLNDTRGSNFVGATYTIFINSNGQAFASSNV